MLYLFQLNKNNNAISELVHIIVMTIFLLILKQIILFFLMMKDVIEISI